MKESETPESKPYPGYKKYGAIFIVSIVCAVVMNLALGHTGSDPTMFASYALGTAIGIFAIPAFIAIFIKGKKGSQTGIFLTIAFTALSWYGQYEGNESERTFLNNLEGNFKAIQEEGRANIRETGTAGMDVESHRNALAQMEHDAASLRPKERAVAEGLSAVHKEILRLYENSAAAVSKVESAEFFDTRALLEPGVIAERLIEVEGLRQSYMEYQGFYENLDIQIKSELIARGLTALEAKRQADAYISASKPALTRRMMQLNLDYADLLTRRFELLQERFGYWEAGPEQMVIFEQQSSVDRWNALMRELVTMFEERERVERQIFNVPLG